MAGGPSVPTQVLYTAVGVYNGPIPKEGPKTVPVPLDFSTQNSYTVDFTMLQQRGLISELQAVFVDNADNDQQLIITVNGTQQRVVVPPGGQGIFPIFAPNPPRFTVQTTGLDFATTLQFLNVPVTCLTWSGTGTPFQFTGANALVVSDSALDSIISNGALATSTMLTGNNDNLIPNFVGDDLFTGQASLAAAQTIIVGNAGWFFTYADIQISPDAAMAAAGEITVTLTDTGAAVPIARGVAYLPASSPATPQPNPISILRLENLQYNGKVAGNLTLTLSAALTAGKCTWNFAGGITNVLGP